MGYLRVHRGRGVHRQAAHEGPYLVRVRVRVRVRVSVSVV